MEKKSKWKEMMRTDEADTSVEGLNALPFPDRVTVELTNHCNLRCVMCPREHMTSPKGYMEFALFKKIVDEMVPFGQVALVPFFRGETLLHPKWVEMLGYAKERGIGPIQFATNATLMNEEAAEALLGLELDFVSFSLDSIDPSIYRSVRRGAGTGDCFEQHRVFLRTEGKKKHEETRDPGVRGAYPQNGRRRRGFRCVLERMGGSGSSV